MSSELRYAASLRLRAPGFRIGPVGAVVVATIVGGAVRFSTMGLQSYWDDEAFTVHLLHLSFVDMLQTVPRTERTPHLYYVVAWLWAQVGGSGEWGLRAVSAAVGTATIPASYLAARAVGSVRGAVIAAFLVAGNPFLIWYSQEARAYALLALLCVLSFLAFGRALQRQPRALLWWAIITLLAVATHYFAIFVGASEAAWLLFCLGIRRATVAATAVVGLVTCALVWLAVVQAGRHPGADSTPLRTRVAQVPVHLLVGYGVTSVTVGKVAIATTAVLLGFAVWLLVARASREAKRGAALAGGVALTAVLLPIVGAFGGADYVKSLYFLAAVPLFAVAVAQGFASTRSGLVAGLALTAIGLSLAGYVATTPWLQRPDLRGVASSLGPPQVDRAIVLAPTMRIDVYMQGLYAFPARGQRVREVDFVVLPVKAAGGLPRVPRELARPFAVTGFKRSKQVFGEGFTIVGFRASSPRLVSKTELLGASFREWPRALSSVVLQKPPG